MGADSGGDRAAAMDSRTGTVKRNDIDPQACRRHVLTHIADHRANRIDELLSGNLAATLAPAIA